MCIWVMVEDEVGGVILPPLGLSAVFAFILLLFWDQKDVELSRGSCSFALVGPVCETGGALSPLPCFACPPSPLLYFGIRGEMSLVVLSLLWVLGGGVGCHVLLLLLLLRRLGHGPPAHILLLWIHTQTHTQPSSSSYFVFLPAAASLSLLFSPLLLVYPSSPS